MLPKGLMNNKFYDRIYFKAINYYWLDGPGVTKPALLNKIKTQLVMGIPSIFGFTTFPSMDCEENERGKIPFPGKKEKSDEGHAIIWP